MMLKNVNAFASYSVDNTDAAKDFYEGKLGLERIEGEGPVRYKVGNTQIMIYSKPNHEPATFTVMNFIVEDIDAKVDEFIANGITFEKYDNEHMTTDEKGILRNEHGEIAWFKDPAGNILSLIKGL